MDWHEALEIEVGRSKHERWRVLTADDHPDHEHHRARVIELATGQAPAEYPSLFRQAANLAGSIGQVVAAAVQGRPIRVSTEVYNERLAICQGCIQFDAAQSRCRICGCHTAAKLATATESCPLPEPKWKAVTHDS